jgi:hypothetical protein
MYIGRLFIVFLLSFIFSLPGCKVEVKKGQGLPQTLATVNGVSITGDDVVLKMGGHEHLINSPRRDRVLDDIINEELLYQKGVKLGLDKDAKFQGVVRMMELRIAEYKRAEIARRVIDTQIAAKTIVTDQEIKDYYDKHVEEIGTDLHLGLLHFATEAEAKDALTRIRSGISFEKIADEKFAHVPKGKARPWDMGFMHWNQINPDLLGTVYSLKKGEVSDVLDRSPNGAYLIKIIDRRKNINVKLESMRTAVENRLNAIKAKEAYGRYVQQLKSNASIKKYQEKNKS